ncbi:MAG TPA: prepilin-type N-terminal cleavage/methylation domain-containing protein [Candidatus Saccharibacteria bacterium]|nr:prepilin-type N-terminal cleavage/methylation domain-containing protein [Candidatus Saccharibacteria bacterium]HRK93783.1 prepilin-type N-terminal cleavage/methylation domain-containing protein [Candidatus Saccharibacteria bacterium]
MKRPNRQAGFTLLELFVVVAALVILLLVVFFMRAA